MSGKGRAWCADDLARLADLVDVQGVTEACELAVIFGRSRGAMWQKLAHLRATGALVDHDPPERDAAQAAAADLEHVAACRALGGFPAFTERRGLGRNAVLCLPLIRVACG